MDTGEVELYVPDLTVTTEYNGIDHRRQILVGKTLNDDVYACTKTLISKRLDAMTPGLKVHHLKFPIFENGPKQSGIIVTFWGMMLIKWSYQYLSFGHVHLLFGCLASVFNKFHFVDVFLPTESDLDEYLVRGFDWHFFEDGQFSEEETNNDIEWSIIEEQWRNILRLQ